MKITGRKTPKFIQIIGSILFVIGTSSLITYLFHGSRTFSSFGFYIKYASFGFALGFAFWLGHVAIGKYIVQKLDWTKNLKKANIISLLCYIIFGIIVSIFIPYFFSHLLWGMSGQDLFVDVSVKALMLIAIDMTFVSIYYTTYLTKYWKKSIEINEELKRENLLAKYEALKKQVNPHFLFNSLNTLSGVVEQKPELGTSFIKKLSDIYRYVLEYSDKELVALSDEMKFVEDYIFLSKMRFGDALEFNANLPSNADLQIVPLGLQTLVENAIKHNVITDDMPLKIEIGIDDDQIIVKNNIQKKKSIIAQKEPMGLENLKHRYAYLSNSLMEIVKSDKEFIVKLPIIKA